MKRSPIEEGSRWWRQALQDYDDALYCQEGRRFHLTAFLAQQSAEKAIKAFLYAQGVPEVRGHSVAELVRAAARIDRSFKGIQAQAALLDKYCIPTRYPNGLPGGIPAEAFDAHDAERALELARLVLETVREKGIFPLEEKE